MNVSVEDFEAAGIGHLLDAVQDAVAEPSGGWCPNVAIVSEQFGGRETLLDCAEREFDGTVERISFESVVVDGLPDFEGADAFLVEDCHYLYTRQIGGFALLDRFVKRISTADSLFVTSWNRHAWDYLSAVRDIADAFPTQVVVPSLAPEQTADLLKADGASELPEFVQTEETGRVKTVGFRRREAALPGGRTFDLTVPELNVEYLTSRDLSEDENIEDIEAVVFQKIARLSNGNPGVARMLWERCTRGGTVSPSDVDEFDHEFEFDDDEAFVLRVLLAKERVAEATLDDVLGGVPVRRTLQRLVERGVVDVDDGVVTVVPEYLHAVDRRLRRRRLLW